MEIGNVVQLIGSLGFPITACCGLFWYLIKSQTQFTATIESLGKSLDENTVVLTQLRDRLDFKEVK